MQKCKVGTCPEMSDVRTEPANLVPTMFNALVGVDGWVGIMKASMVCVAIMVEALNPPCQPTSPFEALAQGAPKICG